MIKNSALFQLQFAQVQRLWRKWRRMHAVRAAGERRILVVGAVAVTWFICDSLLLTPAMSRFQSSNTRYKRASTELESKQEQQRRYSSDMVAMTAQLKGDVERLRTDVARQKKDIDSFQEGLVPARDMRQLLQAVLTGRSDLRLMAMKTLTPEEVRKLSPGIKDMPGLFRHGLELRLQGSFHGLLEWLSTMENWPRKVLWSGLKLELDDKQQLFLTVTLFTLSPDADPLEIAAP
jgi:MSHA biogenesis protein MshJ